MRTANGEKHIRNKLFVIVLLSILMIMTYSLIANKAYATDNFDFSINYDNDVKCGVDTVFTLEPINGSGNYSYYLNSVTYDDGTESYMVEDCTVWEYKNYQTSNQFTYKFAGSGTYKLKFYVMDKGVSPVSIINKTITINITDTQYPSVQDRANKVVQECLSKAGNSDYDKALWLHDWLLDNMKYDKTYHFCSTESAFCRGMGTCESYHRAYVILLSKAGIESGRIQGNGHVWTAVKMDGKWYQIDTTWDDVDYNSEKEMWRHLYFGLTDELMKVAHTDHNQNKGYESNSLTENYLIKSGVIKTYSDKFVSQAKEKVNNKEYSFELAIDDNRPESVAGIIYPIAAYQLCNELKVTIPNCKDVSATYSNNKISCTITIENKKQEPEKMPEPETKPVHKHSYVHYSVPGQYMQHGYCYDRCACGATRNYQVLEGYSTSYVQKFKLSKGKKCFTARWKSQKKKVQKQFSGYQLRYSSSPDMSGAGYINVSKKKSSRKVKGLASKATYYVQVRSYVCNGAGTFYSDWSILRAVKIR